MKRTILAIMVLLLATGGVSAQNTGKNTQKGMNKNCPAYVDNNKDGVCDNVGTSNCAYPSGQNFRQGRMGAGRGQRYNGPGTGNRNGRSNMQGKNMGGNFVDANNNGICDTYESSAKK